MIATISSRFAGSESCKPARKEFQAARRKRSHFLGKFVGRDLDGAVGNADDDGFLGADDLAGNAAEGRPGFGDGEHVHKPTHIRRVTTNRSINDTN